MIMLMIHYIYKIIFLRGYPTGRYYLGKRSYPGSDLIRDTYSGSGYFCDEYFEEYGKSLGDTYIKEIIEINPSKKINSDREEIIIGDLWKTDPLCMNRCPGGGALPPNKKEVIQYNIYGEFITTYDSISDAAESVGLNGASTISACCISKKGSSAGYIWRFINEPLTKNELKDIVIHSKPIKQYTEDLQFVKQWNSAKEAGDNLNINAASIIAVCTHSNKKRHTAGGFVWCYYNEEPVINKTVPFKGKRKVKQYTKDSHQFIKEFESLKDAATEINGNWQHIQKCCNDLKPSAYGYWWRFSD